LLDDHRVQLDGPRGRRLVRRGDRGRPRPVQRLMGTTSGDLQAVQNRILTYQGQREHKMSQRGAMRRSVFRAPLAGGPPIGELYGPWEDSSIQTIIECPFSVAFADEPMLEASIALADGEEWAGDSFPAFGACVVNWRRVAGHQMFVG